MVSVHIEDRLIEWDPTALERLRREVVDGFHLSPPSGEERIGILYGRETQTGWRIVNWRMISKETSVASALPLTESEEADLFRLLRARGVAAVGFFRSRTRTNAFLTPEDDQLCKRLFPSQPSVAMILRPSYQRPATAAFFTVTPDGIVEKPLRGVETLLEPLEVLSESDQALAAESIPLPGFLGGSIDETEVRSRQWSWKLPVLVVLGAVLIALPIVYQLVDRPLKLEADVNQKRLYISWNRFAGILSQATGAELQLSDRTTELNIDQLRLGKVSASLPDGDFKIQLVLRGPYASQQRAVILFAQQ